MHMHFISSGFRGGNAVLRMIVRRLSFPEAHVPHFEGVALRREIMIHLESAAAKMSLDDGGRATLLHLGYLRGICSRSNTLKGAQQPLPMPVTPPDALRGAGTRHEKFHRVSGDGSASAPADAQRGDASAALYN
jgi:hypothetical protein